MICFHKFGFNILIIVISLGLLTESKTVALGLLPETDNHVSRPERMELRRDGATVYSYNTYFQHISSSIVDH